MPRTIYSRSFIAQAGLTGRGASVIVPAGFVYVVKDVTVYAGRSAVPIDVFFEHEPSGAALLHTVNGIGGGIDTQWAVGLVFEAGEGFHFQVDNPLGTEHADVSAAGFALTSS